MKVHLQFMMSIILVMFIQPLNVHAQQKKKPKWEARMAIGILPTFLGKEVNVKMRPVSFEIQYRPKNKLSLGFFAGRSVHSATIKHHTGDEQYLENQFTLISLRGAIHSHSYQKWGYYGGIFLGYTHSSLSYSEDQVQVTNPRIPVPKLRNGLLYSGFIGMDYQIKEKVHAFGELGYGLSLLSIGLNYRF